MLMDDLFELTIDSWCCEGKGQDVCDLRNDIIERATRGHCPKGNETRARFTQLEPHCTEHYHFADGEKRKKCN
jgi:hypothetical protein